MSKHTPGPWSVYDDHYTMQDGVEIRRLEILALGKTVARIYTSVPEQDTPNARLIGAAPDLLAALERTLSWLSSYPGECALGAYEQARAAIEKATP